MPKDSIAYKLTTWVLECEGNMSEGNLIKWVWGHKLGDLEVWAKSKKDASKVIEQYLGFPPLMNDIKESPASPQDIPPIDHA